MPSAPRRLERDPRLDLADAVAVNLNAMVGAGVFVALGMAADLAGPGLLVAILLAGILAAVTAAAPMPAGDGPAARLHAAAVLAAGVAAMAALGRMGAAYIAPQGGAGLHRLLCLAILAAAILLATFRVPFPPRAAGASLAIKVAALAFVAGLALPAMDRAHFHPALPNGLSGLWKATAVLAIAFGGFRFAAGGREEGAPRMAAPVSVLLAAALCAVVAFAALGSVGLLFSARDLEGRAFEAPLLIVAALSNIPLPARIVTSAGALTAAFSVLRVILTGLQRAAGPWAPSLVEARWYPLLPGVVAVALALAVPMPVLVACASLALLVQFALLNTVAGVMGRGGARALHIAAAVASVLLAAVCVTLV